MESLCPQLPNVIAMFDCDYIDSIQELFDKSSLLIYLHVILQNACSDFIYIDFVSNIHLTNFIKELDLLFPRAVHKLFVKNLHDDKENISETDSAETKNSSVTEQSLLESRSNSYLKVTQKISNYNRSELTNPNYNSSNPNKKPKKNQKPKETSSNSTKHFNKIKPQKYYFEYYYLFRFLEHNETKIYNNQKNESFSEDDINYLELLQSFKLKLHIYTGVLLKPNEYDSLIANTSGDFNKIHLFKEYEKVIILISEEYDYIYFLKIDAKSYNKNSIKLFIKKQLENAKEELSESIQKKDFYDMENYKQHYMYCIPDFNCNTDIYEKTCEYEIFCEKECEENFYLEEKYLKSCGDIFGSFFEDFKWN